MALGFNEADAFVKGPQSQRKYLDGSYNIQGKGDDRQVMFRQKHSLDLLPVLPGIQHVFKRNLLPVTRVEKIDVHITPPLISSVC